MSDQQTQTSLPGRQPAITRQIDPALKAAIQRLAERIESLEQRVRVVDAPYPRRRAFVGASAQSR